MEDVEIDVVELELGGMTPVGVDIEAHGVSSFPPGSEMTLPGHRPVTARSPWSPHNAGPTGIREMDGAAHPGHIQKGTGAEYSAWWTSNRRATPIWW